MSLAGAVSVAFFFFVCIILARVDFLGGMVLGQVEKAVNEQLRAEVSIGPLAGNPITGFSGEALVISRSGNPMITARAVNIDISLRSLFTGSPRVGKLTLDGLRTDYDFLVALMPEKKEDKGPVDIPVNRIVINESEISTRWGVVELDASSLKPRNTEWFEFDLSGAFASVPAAVKGAVRKIDGSWTLDDVLLKLSDGSANLSGAAFPTPDLALTLKNIELGDTAKFVPGLKKMLIRGSVTGSMKMRGTGDYFSISGDGTLKGALIGGIPFSEVGAAWNYSKKLFDLKIHKGNVFKSSVDGIFRLDSRGSLPVLKLDARIANLDFSDWTDKIPDGTGLTRALNGTETLQAKHLSGSITSLRAELEGPLNALYGFVKLAPSSIGYKTLNITGISGQVLFAGKPSGSVDFSALYKNNKMTLSGDLSFSKNTATDVRFKAGALDLGEIASVLDGLKNFGLSGAVSVSGSLSGLFSNWTARGEIASSNVTGGRYGVFKNIRLVPEYHFSNGSLSLAQSYAEWNDAKVTADGVLTTGGESWGLDLRGTLEDAHTANFETLAPSVKTMGIDAVISGEWRLGGTLAAPTVAASISAKGTKFRNLGIKSVSGSVNYVPEKLTVDKADLRLDDGKALLDAEVLFPRGAGGAYLPVLWSVSGIAFDLPGSAINGALGLDEDFGGTVSGPFKAGDNGSGIEWDIDLHGKDLSWREFKAEEANGRIRGDTSVVDIENMEVSFLRGEHYISGRVKLAGKGHPADDGELDLKLETKNLNIYELLRKHVPTVRGFQGLVKGSAALTGTIGTPQIRGSGMVAPLRFRSFLLPMVNLEFGGSLSDLRVDAATVLKEGTLTATAHVMQEDGVWKAEASADGAQINLNQLGRYLPEAFREKLAGNADFTLKGSGKLGAFSGEGSFRSDRLKIWNVDLSSINAPFYIAEGYAIVEDVKAKSNGGDISGGVAFDLAQNHWGGNIAITSADIDTFLAQAAPQLPGTVTGKGELKIRAGGETGRMSSVRAAGVVRLFNGALSGFSAVEAAQKFTRGNPLRFETVQATFSYAGDYLTILPGSQAVAPKNDPVYRYMMLDGTVDENGVLGLFAMGKANIQALNALLGALQGLMDLGVDFNESLDKAELLQGIIGGALTGFSRNDFRFVTMGIRGTYNSPRFENIRVQRSSKNESEAIPKSISDPKEEAFGTGNKTFKFRFEIPVGPGVAPGSGIDDQARGQILKNALDSLLRNTDF